MTSCLFNGTSCPFSRCCLNFATSYDLIAHIEDAHCNTPPINVVDNEQNKFVRPNSVYNLFPGGYKPIPVPKVATKLNFECYKKRTTSGVGSLALSRMRGSESERTDDGEDGEGDGEERKYKCTIDGCDRRYKNLQGVKYHMRSAHGKPEETATVGGILGIERGGGGGSITGGMLPIGNTISTLDGSIAATVGQVVSSTTGLNIPPTPTKYAMSRPHKCPHCCKRYKTTTGMSNHMAAAHNKQTPSSSSLDSTTATSSVQQSVHEILARTAKEVQAQEEMREQQQAILEGKTVGAVLQSGMARHAQLRLINQQQQQQMQLDQSTVQQQQQSQSTQQQQQQQPQGGSLPPPVPSPMGQQPSMGSGSGGGQGMQSHPSHSSHSSHHSMQQQMQSQQHLSTQSQSMQHHQQMQQQAYYQQMPQGTGGQPQYIPQRTVREEMMEKMEESRGAGGGGMAIPPLNQPSQRRMSRPSMNMHYREDMLSSSIDPSGGNHVMSGAGPSPSHSHQSHSSHSSHPSHPHGPPPTSTVRLLPPAEEMFHQRESLQMDQQHYRVQSQPSYQSMPPQYQRGPLPSQSSYHHQIPQQSSDGYSQQQQRLQYPQEGETYSVTPRVGGPLPSITTSFTSDPSYQYSSSNQYAPPTGPPQYSNQSQYGDTYGQQQPSAPHYYGDEKRDGRPMDHHDYSR